jgi:hypothetical protein
VVRSIHLLLGNTHCQSLSRPAALLFSGTLNLVVKRVNRMLI